MKRIKQDTNNIPLANSMGWYLSAKLSKEKKGNFFQLVIPGWIMIKDAHTYTRNKFGFKERNRSEKNEE